MRKPSRGFTLIELMIVVAIIGLLASVAIPSFIKYTRRSMTVEATMNIRRMYDGAVTYYVAEHADANGVAQDRKFPASAGPTPATIPAAVKVVVPQAQWSSQEWQQLDFMLTDPIRFSYSFDSNNGSGAAAFAQMIAQGDLDGDGIPSLYQRSCTGINEGVRGGAGVYVINDIE